MAGGARQEEARADAAQFLEAMAATSLTPEGERDYGRVVFMLASMLRTVHHLVDAPGRGHIEETLRRLLVVLYEGDKGE